MSRKLKPQPVKEYLHRTGIVVPVCLDRESMLFVATYGEDDFQEATAEQLYAKLREHLDSCVKIEWAPVVELTITTNSVEFEFDRFYLGKSPAGPELRRLHWNGFEVAAAQLKQWGDANIEICRLRCSNQFHRSLRWPLVLPYGEESHHDTIYWLNYTEALWAGLEELSTSLDRLRNKLHDMLKTPHGRSRIVEVGEGIRKLLE